MGNKLPKIRRPGSAKEEDKQNREEDKENRGENKDSEVETGGENQATGQTLTSKDEVGHHSP